MLHFYGIFLPRLTIDLFWKTIYGTSPSDIKSNLEGCWSATICSPANLFRGNPLTKADLKQQNILCIYLYICKKLCLLIWSSRGLGHFCYHLSILVSFDKHFTTAAFQGLVVSWKQFPSPGHTTVETTNNAMEIWSCLDGALMMSHLGMVLVSMEIFFSSKLTSK